MKNPNPSRRTFIKSSMTVGLYAGIGLPLIASCSQPKKSEEEETSADISSFSQEPLPYGYDALEPSIDARTMEIHYTKHHAGYVNNLNKAMEEDSITVSSLEDLLGSVSKYSTAVRNNGGGHYNHQLFWKIMKPGGGEQPGGKLAEAINGSFGSFDQFKDEFSQAASTRFGSGWAWLAEHNGNLVIGSTPNQDNPLMDISEFKGKPLLGIDVWEHAYYLNYQNRRADYIKAFFDIINWEAVAANFDAIA
ncbi:MAG: superoxide dismutase [Cyclobacteriaceae bacterium]